MRVLGVDFGLRSIGLAASDEEARLATPLRSLDVRSVDDAPKAVATVAREIGAGAVVVGVPYGMEGEEGRIELRRVKRFARALRTLAALPVHFMDESLSSREAGERADQARGRTRRREAGKRGARDDARAHAAAAAVILQRWLDERAP